MLQKSCAFGLTKFLSHLWGVYSQLMGIWEAHLALDTGTKLKWQKERKGSSAESTQGNGDGNMTQQGDVIGAGKGRAG